MNQESSSVESVNTTTSTLVRTPKESTKPDVNTAQQEGTLETDMPSLTGESSPEPTPNELVALGRPPYIIDIIDARMAYETFDVKKQVAEIDEYIREGIEDSRTSYEGAVRGLLSHIKETDSVYTKIEMLRDYVRIQAKLRGIVKEREEFEKLDPEEMTAKQLKRYLNGR